MTNIEIFLLKNFSFKLEDISSILSRFDLIELKSDDFFLKEGQFCKSVAFIEDGCFMYSQLIDGEEKVCDFAIQNEWISQYESLLNNTASTVNIKAMTHASIWRITISEFEKLTKQFPKINSVRTYIAEQHFKKTNERANQLAVLNAEKRYRLFIKSNPEIIQKVPQYYIASYLGIKPQSLSRIRSKK